MFCGPIDRFPGHQPYPCLFFFVWKQKLECPLNMRRFLFFLICFVIIELFISFQPLLLDPLLRDHKSWFSMPYSNKVQPWQKKLMLGLGQEISKISLEHTVVVASMKMLINNNNNNNNNNFTY